MIVLHLDNMSYNEGEVLFGSYMEIWTYIAETVRIRLHLRRIEATLRAASISVEPEDKALRLKYLDLLRTYINRSIFPRNYSTTRPIPYFVDAEGRVCAVGYLMVKTGGQKLARQIATHYNNFYISDVDVPVFNQWIAQSGFTKEELSMIQPEYCNGFGSNTPSQLCSNFLVHSQNPNWTVLLTGAILTCICGWAVMLFLVARSLRLAKNKSSLPKSQIGLGLALLVLLMECIFLFFQGFAIASISSIFLWLNAAVDLPLFVYFFRGLWGVSW